MHSKIPRKIAVERPGYYVELAVLPIASPALTFAFLLFILALVITYDAPLLEPIYQP
jgi:hypothetical protein